MLDPWVIEQVIRREQQEQRDEARPALRLPLLPLEEQGEAGHMSDHEEKSERGVAIVDFTIFRL